MRFLAFLLLTTAAFAQNAERTLQFRVAETPQDRQEILTAVRTISDLRNVSADPSGSIRVAGPVEQVKLAEWVFAELDQSGIGSSPSNIYDFAVQPPEDGNKVRVFYAPFAETVQQFQEAVTMVRTITDTRRVFQYNSRRAMIIRGNEAQVRLTETLFDELSRNATGSVRHGMSDVLRYESDPKDPFVRVFFGEHSTSPEQFQGLVTAVRTMSGSRRVFQYNARQAFMVRGTEEQIEVASWLFDELDRPAGGSRANAEHLVPGSDEVVRILYLNERLTEQGAREIASKVQGDKTVRSFMVAMPPAIVVRGKLPQVLELERLTQN